MLVIGGLYGGFVTVVEAASLGVMGALVIGMARGRLPWKEISACLVEALRISAAIFMLIIGVFLFQYFLAVTQTSQQVAAWLSGLPYSPLTIMIFIVLGFPGNGGYDVRPARLELGGTCWSIAPVALPGQRSRGDRAIPGYGSLGGEDGLDEPRLDDAVEIDELLEGDALRDGRPGAALAARGVSGDQPGSAQDHVVNARSSDVRELSSVVALRIAVADR